ncbi:hypothetical protein ABIC08_008312 [Bradyrhizobium sp. RT9b]|uniref:hypothetical protein n=1 Tax=Bradyrhizobium sp. RT9b TaxID=3156385 RepID=UPI0033968CFD
MAKKAAVKKAPKKPRQPRKDSLLVHAEAISELAAAIRQHAEAISAAKGGQAQADVVADDATVASRVTLPPLSADQIKEGIEGVFNTKRVLKDDDDLNALIPGDPARLVAMWQDIDDYPAFRQRGLALGPNDLRYVKTVKDLVGIIAWGLRNALIR